jgi:hypothetical protein
MPQQVECMETELRKTSHPGYALVMDHQSRSIVLAVRGTLTIQDTLTDLAAEMHPFLTGYAHQGMSSSL